MSNPTEPTLTIASIPNLRDLGGIATADGRQIRRGVVYRSDQLSHVTEADMVAFDRLGLKNVVDLRTAEERSAQPDRLPNGAQGVVADVLADMMQTAAAQIPELMTNPAKLQAALGDGKAVVVFGETYANLVRLPSARTAYAELFGLMADDANLPVLFHCTTGKDRTGWAAAALLMLCGVDPDAVMADYLRSNDFILPAYKPMIDQFTAEGVDEEILISLLGVRREYLARALDEMTTTYGDIQTYFEQGLGIDRAQQSVLQAQLIA